MPFSSVFSFCAEMKKLHSYVPRGRRNLCISKEYSVNNPLQLVVIWKAKKNKKLLGFSSSPFNYASNIKGHLT